MASKNITITEDAYERLRALKRADESFSDVITRLTASSADHSAFAGSCPGMGDAAAAARAELEDDLEETHSALFGQ